MQIIFSFQLNILHFATFYFVISCSQVSNGVSLGLLIKREALFSHLICILRPPFLFMIFKSTKLHVIIWLFHVGVETCVLDMFSNPSLNRVFSQLLLYWNPSSRLIFKLNYDNGITHDSSNPTLIFLIYPIICTILNVDLRLVIGNHLIDCGSTSIKTFAGWFNFLRSYLKWPNKLHTIEIPPRPLKLWTIIIKILTFSRA